MKLLKVNVAFTINLFYGWFTARCSVASHVWQDMMMESGTRLLFSEYLHKVKTELTTLQVPVDH